MSRTRVFLALSALAAGSVLSGPAAATGMELWRECRVCHMVATPDGRTLERGGRSAPNLFGVAGRTAGTDPTFRRYSTAMERAGNAGLVWTRDNFIAYLADPAEFLRQRTGDFDARGHMNATLADSAGELFDYLQSLSR